MTLPLVLLHTAAGNERTFAALLREMAPAVPARHVRRDDLLQQALDAGSLTADIRHRAAAALRRIAADAGALLCTCSTLGPAADDVAALAGAAPVLRVDRPMADEAVRRGRRIAVCATFATTLEPTLALLRESATAAGRDVLLQPHLFADAAARFAAGDDDGYLAAVTKGLTAAAARADVAVLAQASMAAALERCDTLAVPVLTSPRSGLAAAIAAWRSATAR